MKALRGKSKEHITYYVGLSLLVLGVALYALIQYGIWEPFHLLPPCVFHAITGLPCPGCGCTRALRAIVQADFIASFKFNPVILYMFGWYTLYMITHTFEWIRYRIHRQKSENVSFYPHHRYVILPRLVYIYIGIAVLLIQWLIKLILIFLTKTRI